MKWNTLVSILQVIRTLSHYTFISGTTGHSCTLEILSFVIKMFVLEELKFIIFELMFNTTLLDCFIHPFWIGTKRWVGKHSQMWIHGKYSQATLKSAFSDSFLNQGIKHSQPDFEEGWLKILTRCTHWIITIHTSAQPLWSFQQKPENAKKKSRFILCCLSTRNETLMNLDNIYICIYTCRLEFMLTTYAG